LFDVGIAEEHAVSMAGGMAKQGLKPVVALYSTFLQRSYDMLMQDIALLKLPVVIAIDRAGLVGEDGETHHGIFDVGFLRQIPGMQILCPGSCKELRQMLRWAVNEQPGPVAIRYPRGGDHGYSDSAWSGLENMVACHRKGEDVTIITYGTLLDNAMKAAELLSAQGVEATVLRLLSVSHWDTKQIHDLMSAKPNVFVMEEVCGGSGILEALAMDLDANVTGVDLGHNFVTHGSMDSLYLKHGLDPQSVCDRVLEVLRSES
jgi:1-deoxy-D-xylulose-5-phosphate synthase